ncbi:hypothetical protein L3X38_035402 [Prunus dulcis]|uniref:Uncharacterized protein n=1 Tax=Prunus dulcis TaxID=3755 RepID=A0AAD4VJV1_PRUDU|nr:hypothetical protein L3X38_035402 [Prunus dulcis]
MDTLDQLRNRRCTGPERQLRGIGIHLGSASKEKARGMGPTGLAKTQNQAHPNWGWDRLAKRNQEAWDPPDWQKLKTKRTLNRVGIG